MNYVNTDSYFPNPYTESAPYGLPDTGGLTTPGGIVRWQNANRYQLISAGHGRQVRPWRTASPLDRSAPTTRRS